MLEAEVRELAEAKIAADIREYAATLRADVGKAVAELASRGVLRSSMAIKRISGLGVTETRRRAAVVWQVLQEAVRAADIRYDDSLPNDLREVVKRYLPERPEDLLSLLRVHGSPGGTSKMSAGVDEYLRSAALLAREKLGAEIDIFVMSLKHGQKRTGTSPEELETEGLTGLYRREVFERRGPVLIADAKKNGVPLSLLMIDLDHFKSINDMHGHQGGDEALRVVGGILKKAVDGKGEGYRWGGDELAALLPNYSPDEAITLAERVRREVESAILTQQDQKFTVSIGVASFPDHGKDHVELHRAADKALYDAKHQGRNLVRLHGEPPPSAQGKREPKRREPEPGGLSEEAKRKIREDYFKTRNARCPQDSAFLSILELDQDIGQRSVYIIASCPLCGLEVDLPGDDR